MHQRRGSSLRPDLAGEACSAPPDLARFGRERGMEIRKGRKGKGRRRGER